jgi:YfiH family protein
MTSNMTFSVEQTAIGRIVVAPEVPAGTTLFYTTRDYAGAIGEELQALVGMPVQHCLQVHGCGVRRPCRRSADDDALHTCDALWSAEPCALAIKTADCLPVSIIADGVIANIHCGWRGSVQRIVDVTLDALTPFDPAAASAWLGPAIRVCCFEVGEEVVDQFRASYADVDAFVDRSRVKPHVDVVALTAARLRARGIARIHDSGLCTRCEGSIFHSFRRDGKRGGRNLAVLTKA